MTMHKKIKLSDLDVLMFDIDGTLCNQESEDYLKAQPILKRIEMINELKTQGKYIKLFTSRGVRSGKDWTSATSIQLKSWGLSYDELIFGKPHYDLFIDDKSVYSEDFPWIK